MIENQIIKNLEHIEYVGRENSKYIKKSRYLCYCGNTFIARESHVNAGNIVSCGCYQKEYLSTAKIKHGGARRGKHSVEYSTWRAIKARCTNPNTKSYSNYGGRGIKMCGRWLNSFSNFLEDMGERPSKYHSIDRIENDGNYEPSNCRWATKKEQSRNTRVNTYLTFKGETKCLTDWAEEYGITPGALSQRLNKGASVEKALLTPF